MHRLLPFFALLVLGACATVATDNAPVERAADASAQKPIDSATDKTATGDTKVAAGADATAAATDTASALALNHPKISDTQNFSAVTAKLTPKQDEALLAEQRKQFKVIQPTALPKRVKTISVVQYALSTANSVGEKKYSRFNPLGARLAVRNCARYDESDQAQLAFLRAGGPRRDPLNLDPDGDGFACDWSPDTYRKLVRKKTNG